MREVLIHIKYLKKIVKSQYANYSKISTEWSRSGKSINIYQEIGYVRFLIGNLTIKNSCFRRRDLLKILGIEYLPYSSHWRT